MPTHEEADRFWRDWDTLSPSQQAAFLRAVGEMVEVLRVGRPFRPRLRVKMFQQLPGVCEMSWADNGRALFVYGTSPRPGDVHVKRLRVGTHDIFQNP